MLKASENFKLLKTVVFEGMNFFLIEHQGQEYISFGYVFVRNTLDNLRELVEEDYGWWFDFKKGYKKLLNSPPVSGWEVLTYGDGCFWGCPFEIGHWNIDLPSLVNGDWMFWDCKTLTRFSGNLDSLERGDGMFKHSGLAVFESALPSLESGVSMFESCRSLGTFSSSLPRLKNGRSMFKDSYLA